MRHAIAGLDAAEMAFAHHDTVALEQDRHAGPFGIVDEMNRAAELPLLDRVAKAARRLEQAGLLVAGSRRTILANQLVLVVAADGGAPIADLPDLAKPAVKRIAIGEPATVPVGTYTKEHLQKLGLWPQVSSKCVPLDNVRAVLGAVEAGNADAGLVYRTDALISKKVWIPVEVPLAEGPKITYPAAVLRDAKEPEAAAKFVAFLAGPEAREVFAKYGFLPVP